MACWGDKEQNILHIIATVSLNTRLTIRTHIRNVHIYDKFAKILQPAKVIGNLAASPIKC